MRSMKPPAGHPKVLSAVAGVRLVLELWCPQIFCRATLKSILPRSSAGRAIETRPKPGFTLGAEFAKGFYPLTDPASRPRTK